jgi:Ca2+-binding EF-hand superfamily protein
MSPEEIQGLKEMFKAMDTDNSGSITFEELRDGLKRQGSRLAESEVRQLMDAVSYLQQEQADGIGNVKNMSWKAVLLVTGGSSAGSDVGVG